MTKRCTTCGLGLSSGLMLIVMGCDGYTTPPQTADSQMRHAQLSAGQDISAEVRAAENRKPTATFPAGIAIARVDSLGRGQFTVESIRDIETDEQKHRIQTLPMVSGVTMLGPLQIDGGAKSTQDIRAAAAGMHADLVLLYTISTDVHAEDVATPVSVITLGLAPTQHAKAVTTAQALLLDTRTGFVYGNFEATDTRSQIAAAWTIGDAEQQSTNTTERKAFEKLIDQFVKTWPGVLKEYAGKST